MQFKTPRKNLLEKKIIECLLKLYLLKIYLWNYVYWKYISKRFINFRQSIAQHANYVKDNFLKSALSRTRLRKHAASLLWKRKANRFEVMF